MKKPIQIGTCALAIAVQAVLCSAECVVVQPADIVPSRVLPDTFAVIPLLSSRVVRLTVVGKGKPALGAKVEFYSFGSGGRSKEPTLTLVSDKFGWIKSPKLSDGQYEIVATTAHDLRADLLLDVSSHYGKTPMAFKMELLPINPPYAAPQLATPALTAPEIATLQQVPIENHLQVFRGTVVDPTGAVIPGATIHIFRQGTGPMKLLKAVESGKSGEFETKLDPGTYVASFSSSGFAVKRIGFEIVFSGSEQLIVTLKLGIC